MKKGTAQMNSTSELDPTVNEGNQLDPRLKYDLSGKKPIVLIPQPSDDPDDPLNWSLAKRDTITFVLCLVSIMAATLGPILAANTVTLAFYFDKTFTQVALLTGWHLLGVGVAGFIFVPSARVWGKRHLYILGTVLLVVSSIWGGAAQSYNSLLWARVIQGVAVTPFEALVNASIGDLYPVHQRGKRMAFTNFALYGGAFFTPVIVGKMTFEMSWRWPFYFVGIFSGIMLPAVFFLVPETAFRREINTDMASTENLMYPQDTQDTIANQQRQSSVELMPTKQSEEHSQQASENGEHSQQASENGEQASPKTSTPYFKSLALFNGRKTDESVLKLVLRPFPLLLHPAILWGMLTQGALIGWTVMIGVVLGIIFMGPPLWFSEVKTGYMYTGAFVGAMLGFLVSGLLSDWSAKALSKRNNGVYEPEFRILLVIPQTVLGVIGLIGFGLTCSDIAKYGPYLPSFFFGMEVMGMILGATASALYLVDAHRDLAIESFTCLLLFKNFFSFGLTWKAVDWVAEAGVWRIFWILGVVQVVVGLLSVPMYIFGKRNRSFFHRHDILEMTKLR
ncbi:major facilitator superfamily domain-containing protein [Tricharina praecox]|uniref:major facilitator superfamily domain-containing protein n=1 Tax=Tricharina praecox TaxID=43433 RepID=UPI00221F584E|nr:major facilitator superfamily domain-containing protein [Tricharina praecox]KAI5850010.1 major facilitator superfamily domain-containing protein [Tricharina praecox]